MVRPVRLNDLPMTESWLPPKEVKFDAPSHVRLPVICCTPSRLIVPAAWDAITTSPVTVEQLDRPEASPWFWIVVVGPSH